MYVDLTRVCSTDDTIHYKWWVYVTDDGQRCIVQGFEREPYTPPPDWKDRIVLLKAAWDGSRYPMGAHIPGVGYITGIGQLFMDDEINTILYLFERP